MHWAWAVAQKPFDAAARPSFTREVAASHLVSPSRLQVARQSYILEVSHIHLCDWRRSLQWGTRQGLLWVTGVRLMWLKVILMVQEWVLWIADVGFSIRRQQRP